MVGNFGDGRINAHDGDDFEGQLRGTASTAGADSVWFSAGPNDKGHGLVGQLIPAA